MAELFQYYYDDFKYVYLKNIPKETIASKSLVFGSVIHNYYLFYSDPITNNFVYNPLNKIHRTFNYITSLDTFNMKPENNNNELSIFDSLELYTIMQQMLKEGMNYVNNLEKFVKQKHNECIDIPLELINNMFYKYYLNFKFPVNINGNIKTYLNEKYEYNKICILIDFECDNLSYITNKKQYTSNKYYITKTNSILVNESLTINKNIINNEFYKCEQCGNYYDVSCIQIDNSCLCYYCHYKLYNTYPNGHTFLKHVIDKIKLDDCTFVEIIKDAFIRHFIACFDIEDKLKRYDYDELIKNKDFLNKIYNLNLYKELFIKLLSDSINGEYNEYTLMLIEDFNDM